MKNKNTLIYDLEKIYYSLMCETYENESCRYCTYCKNEKLCKTIIYLLKSLKKYYICNKDFNSCNRCENRLNCKIIQKIY